MDGTGKLEVETKLFLPENFGDESSGIAANPASNQGGGQNSR
jgi:hypothetical protein